MKKSTIKTNNVNNKLKLPAKFKTKPYMAAAAVVALIVVMGGTAYASNDAKPGDALYSIDTTSERIQSLLAFSPVSQADLALGLATERVEETQSVLEATDFDATELNIALDGLTEQRQALADLIVAQSSLKQQAKQYEDAFEDREAALEAIFSDAKSRLKAQKYELKAQIKQAQAMNNSEELNSLMSALITVEVQLRALEAEEEAAEEALEAEEERLEAELDAIEEALEAEEEAAEDALEAEKDAREDEEERLKEEAEGLDDESSEIEDKESEHGELEDDEIHDEEDAPDVESEHDEQDSAEEDIDNEKYESSDNHGRR